MKKLKPMNGGNIDRWESETAQDVKIAALENKVNQMAAEINQREFQRIMAPLDEKGGTLKPSVTYGTGGPSRPDPTDGIKYTCSVCKRDFYSGPSTAGNAQAINTNEELPQYTNFGKPGGMNQYRGCCWSCVDKINRALMAAKMGYQVQAPTTAYGKEGIFIGG
jgi:hypothetical protein